MSNGTVITIGRQFGSGGRAIGRLVAEKLGIPFYDKEIIKRISKESGLSHEILDDYDEKPTNSFLYSLSLGAYTYGNSITGIPEMPMSDKIFVIQSDVIKKIAAEGPCVIVGRCAESILKDEVNCLSIFIHADFDSRIQRVSEYDKISHDQAAEQIRKTDKKRASYHNYYSELKWGAATSYDFCINSKIGIENAAKLIVDIYNMR
ncbi:MAG: cytidylate kinase-like family protein [Acutalibacteraceae bacterium]|nr:cytidylate kinase-like family protein [Acutalibacteraceae bacterium]